MTVDIRELEETLVKLKTTLKDGLLATDIWDRFNGLSLAGYNSQPVSVALLSESIAALNETLSVSGLPTFNRYFYADLASGRSLMIIRHGDELLQGILMDAARVNMGLLLTVVLPSMQSGVAAARFESPAPAPPIAPAVVAAPIQAPAPPAPPIAPTVVAAPVQAPPAPNSAPAPQPVMKRLLSFLEQLGGGDQANYTGAP